MNATSIPAADLASRLLDAASGVPADTAAAGLIIGHGHFLHRPDFRRVITSGASISTGRPLAVISWPGALHALENGLLPCASSEQAVLRIAASLGDPAIPVRLHAVLGNLDPPQHHPGHRRHHRRQRLTAPDPRGGLASNRLTATEPLDNHRSIGMEQVLTAAETAYQLRIVA